MGVCRIELGRLYSLFLQWAREIGRLSDPVVNIPVQSLENVYIVTKPMEGQNIHS